MKYTVKPTTRFQKDLKRIQKRGYDISLSTAVIKKLANDEPLQEKKQRPCFKWRLLWFKGMSYHPGLALGV